MILKQKLNEDMYKDNEKAKEYAMKYRKDNKVKLNEYSKNYYDENKDSINKSKSDKYKNNESERERRSSFSKENRQKINSYRKTYFQNNKDKYRKYKKDRIEKDPIFKLSLLLSSMIRGSIKRMGYTKKSRTYDVLGCSYDEFKLYIESKFEPWMNWDNHGNIEIGTFDIGWDIDHIIPISSAKTEDDVIKLNHYTNLQPLCSYINRYIKKDTIYNFPLEKPSY